MSDEKKAGTPAQAPAQAPANAQPAAAPATAAESPKTESPKTEPAAPKPAEKTPEQVNAEKKAEYEKQKAELIESLDNATTALENMEKAKMPIPAEFAALPDKITGQIAAIDKHIDDLAIYENLKKVQSVFAEAASQLQNISLHSELVVTVKLGRDANNKLTVLEVTPVGKRSTKASGGGSSKGVGKGRTVTVNGQEFPSAAEACRTLNVEIGTNSPVRALNAAAKKESWTVEFAD